jgi:hypothetical protein
MLVNATHGLTTFFLKYVKLRDPGTSLGEDAISIYPVRLKEWFHSRSTKHFRGIGYDEADLEDVTVELNIYVDGRVLHGLSKRRGECESAKKDW